MASVALFNTARREQIPREMWTKRERTIAIEEARAAMDGVGDPQSDTIEDHGTIIALRRVCTDDERRRVLERFLEI